MSQKKIIVIGATGGIGDKTAEILLKEKEVRL